MALPAVQAPPMGCYVAPALDGPPDTLLFRETGFSLHFSMRSGCSRGEMVLSVLIEGEVRKADDSVTIASKGEKADQFFQLIPRTLSWHCVSQSPEHDTNESHHEEVPDDGFMCFNVWVENQGERLVISTVISSASAPYPLNLVRPNMLMERKVPTSQSYEPDARK